MTFKRNSTFQVNSLEIASYQYVPPAHASLADLHVFNQENGVLKVAHNCSKFQESSVPDFWS